MLFLWPWGKEIHSFLQRRKICKFLALRRGNYQRLWMESGKGNTANSLDQEHCIHWTCLKCNRLPIKKPWAHSACSRIINHHSLPCLVSIQPPSNSWKSSNLHRSLPKKHTDSWWTSLKKLHWTFLQICLLSCKVFAMAQLMNKIVYQNFLCCSCIAKEENCVRSWLLKA